MNNNNNNDNKHYRLHKGTSDQPPSPEEKNEEVTCSVVVVASGLSSTVKEGSRVGCWSFTCGSKLVSPPSSLDDARVQKVIPDSRGGSIPHTCIQDFCWTARDATHPDRGASDETPRLQWSEPSVSK